MPLVARSLGVQVRDIVVHPLGGMTRLDWGARDPRKEALISLRGPRRRTSRSRGSLWVAFRGVLDEPGRWIEWVVAPFLMVNVALGALEPRPGVSDGRRAASCARCSRSRLGHLPATRVAARIGRWLAAARRCSRPSFAASFGWSFWQSLAFPIVGLFVFILGEVELKQAEAAELFEPHGRDRMAAQQARQPPHPRSSPART